MARLQRVADNDADIATPSDMLAELQGDSAEMAGRMREVQAECGRHRDAATASLLDTWIDEAERRAWFLFESTRGA